MASCFRSCLCPPVHCLFVTHLRLPVNASGSHPFAGLYTRASAYWHIYNASPSGLLARKRSSSTYKAKKNRLNKSNLFATGLCFWGLPPPPSYSAGQTLQTQRIHVMAPYLGLLWHTTPTCSTDMVATNCTTHLHDRIYLQAVSYTHLTLPTICSV